VEIKAPAIDKIETVITSEHFDFFFTSSSINKTARIPVVIKNSGQK
jgi:hypothetical protein